MSACCGRLLPFVLVVSLAAWSVPVHAQDASGTPAPTGGDEERARALFERANAAADAEDFVDARRLFDESLRILPRAATALNLAGVVRSMGELRECERILVALQHGDYGAPSDRIAALASELLAQARAELAVVRVEASGAETASVRIDADEPFEVTAGALVERTIDPGAHLVLARAEGRRDIEQTIHAAPGEHLALSLGFEVLAATPAAASSGEDYAWLGWTLGAIGLVGVIVGVVVGVVVATQPSASNDPVWGQAMALRFDGP